MTTASDHPVYPDLDGAAVLITGGGTGIGAALTEGFVRQGAKVAFIDIAEDPSLELAERLAQDARHAPLFLHCDLTDLAAIRRAAADAETAHGATTVLVNNAAFDDRHELLDIDGAYWDANQAINLRPVAFAAQAVAPGMIAAGGGAIVNFTSTSYMLNIGSMPSYTAAKAGIVGLTKGLAGRFGPDGIRVNAIAPGWVMTERQRRLMGDRRRIGKDAGTAVPEARPRTRRHDRTLPVPRLQCQRDDHGAGPDRRWRHDMSTAPFLLQSIGERRASGSG
jgi:NAD(P)-dependent dehydrogenase (short-subunit alcohol dehydrogenase family)